MWDWFNYYYGDGTRDSGGSTVSSVPEMDAASGTLAIAVVLAALVLVWELKRRARA
ncbi:VPEID-CTERM sorting domain-containing protein [Roseovarius sp.]|uniref:VPEID-CTERM sorting domain-containing protein n=1 Tax=Roseovarius sp. TaxID=1486281 RepID=UPI0025EE665E|nr:VPEID-CTERM sorting domain-containing protein [Roseovarius sp.]